MLDSWTNKYKPENLDDMILNPDVRSRLGNVLRSPQHLILYGVSGVGKGTFTNIFIKETGCERIWKNASNETGIDMIRNSIFPFATSANRNTWFPPDDDTQNRNERFRYLKLVVFNEAENLSREAQASLRELMENVEHICKFTYMTNDIDKIDNAIKSRCATIEIKDPPRENIVEFMENILNQEGIRHEGRAISNIVYKNYPDIRKIINETENRCHNGELTEAPEERDRAVNRVLLDLRLYMAYYGKGRKEIYDLINDNSDIRVSERQFYYLLREETSNKVSKAKKQAIIQYIQDNIPIRDWFNDYKSYMGLPD